MDADLQGCDITMATQFTVKPVEEFAKDFLNTSQIAVLLKLITYEHCAGKCLFISWFS